MRDQRFFVRFMKIQKDFLKNILEIFKGETLEAFCLMINWSVVFRKDVVFGHEMKLSMKCSFRFNSNYRRHVVLAARLVRFKISLTVADLIVLYIYAPVQIIWIITYNVSHAFFLSLLTRKIRFWSEVLGTGGVWRYIFEFKWTLFCWPSLSGNLLSFEGRSVLDSADWLLSEITFLGNSNSNLVN